MAEHSRFFDSLDPLNPDKVYTADEFTSYFHTLITTGIMKGAGNMLKVGTSGSNMITTVDTGTAFLNGRQYENDSILTLLHEVEALGKSRIDRLVLRLVLDLDARYIEAFVKKGVAGVSPSAPPLERTANVYEISLAQVKVIGGQTYINAVDVTDERGKDVICPWAGSNILPNFDAEGLQDLVEKVATMYSLTNGRSTFDTTSSFGEPAAKNVDDLKETGIYFANKTWGTLGTLPGGSTYQIMVLATYTPKTGSPGEFNLMNCLQIAFSMTSSDNPEIWMRVHSGSWWTWTRVNKSPNLGSVYVEKLQNQVVAANTEVVMQWSNNYPKGDSNLVDAVVNTRLKIPAGLGIRRVRLTACVNLDGTTIANRNFIVIIKKNGTYLDQSQVNGIVPGTSLLLTCITPVLIVDDGDYFEVTVTHQGTGSANTPTTRGVYFGMEVVRRD
ncbi:hypothetical protein I2483_13585 [Sporosarcina sp. E16_3]|uniref:pyocin knob domain-containing protein n=1 Tax=Sporosarcina sp. E16_3 TaxID=2789293 RepID=UPI001A91FA77|nr:pyocin knob domain-containing protein [Sporosarcina sp. E16_3]MBO0602694.1 hypothetical protein [Sporosarcina sp. E16_3]